MTVKDLRGKRVALAASGGLDSCTVTRWLSDQGVEPLFALLEVEVKVLPRSAIVAA